MIKIFVPLLLILGELSFAQQPEFEGEVHYLHLFHFKNRYTDSTSVIKDFGSSSKYYYRNGSYKWTFESSDLQTEYYSGETGKAFDKYGSNDTIFVSSELPEDTILKYEIEKNADTICGYSCDVLKVLIGKKSDSQSVMMRFIYFNKDLPLNPEKFKEFNTYCTNEVFKIIGAIPLRIEVDIPYWPFKMRYEAVKVVKRKINPEELILPKNAIIQELH